MRVPGFEQATVLVTLIRPAAGRFGDSRIPAALALPYRRCVWLLMLELGVNNHGSGPTADARLTRSTCGSLARAGRLCHGDRRVR